MDAAIELNGADLTLADVARVARGAGPLGLAADARARMARSLDWVTAAAAGRIADEAGEGVAVYGVNTGYGSLARVRLPLDDIRRLSINLVRSHAAGMGPPVPPEVTRAMMLLRANALAKGASGCRPVLVETLLQMLDRGVVPEVPSRGSCGSSGDLAPLAHLGLVVFTGDDDDPDASGIAWYAGERLSGAEAMARAGIPRLSPLPKEGLAICNGAQLTTAYAALTAHDARRLCLDADVAAAMSLEALRGVTRAFHPAVHALRPYPGARACSANLLRLVAGSSLTDSLPGKVQDAYSLRCVPQVHGAVRDGIAFVCGQVAIEVNAATDNPIVLVDADGVNKAFSAGLFHGEPVGLAADHLRLVLCELAAISERRTYRLTTGSLSARLPPLLVQRDRPGLGLLAPQSTAAALVAEARSRAWPAGADSIPTCEDQEDLVAMSTTAARRAWEGLDLTRKVLAIELYAATRALRWRLDHEGGVVLGAGTRAAFEAIEARIPPEPCPGDAIAAIDAALREGAVTAAVCDAVPGLELPWTG